MIVTGHIKLAVACDLCGNYHKRIHEDIFNSSYLIIKRKLIRKHHFILLVNNALKSIGVKCRARSIIGSRIKITQDEGVIQNVFVSRHFLMLCGFSSHQLDRVPNSYRNEIGIYFNLSTVVGLVGDVSYCAMNTPPTNIDIRDKWVYFH